MEGCVEGQALVTNDAISFMGTINPKTGYVIERKHEIEGACPEGGRCWCSPCPKVPPAAPTCSTIW